jgi:uridine kinase
MRELSQHPSHLEQIGTGASAMMAIRVLLDHGVLPSHIIFAAFVVASGASGGIFTIQNAFPGVRVVTGAVDSELREAWVGDGEEGEAGSGRKVWHIEPGMGHIGSVYAFDVCVVLS